MSMGNRKGRAYLIGGGIGSLAAAAYLIRDGGYSGSAIEILEESNDIGGSLDAHGTPTEGYRLRGGRMLNYSYACTYDLLSFVPSLTNSQISVLDEILAFNKRFPSSAKARLVENGLALDVSTMGFTGRDRVDLIEMTLRSEDSLGTKRIDECFEPAFFVTKFWFMWATTFAFEPWHSAVEFKRYLHRFIQEFSRIGTLAGVDRTPYNQYDSIVRPLVKWLETHGVAITMSTAVVDLSFRSGTSDIVVESLQCVSGGVTRSVPLSPADLVFATLGSMTAASAWGSMSSAPERNPIDTGSSWALWENIARERPALGHPVVFAGRIEQSTWMSFTMTFSDKSIFERLQAFCGTGLATLKDSNWLMSIVLAHQPHFIDQPPDVCVGWGYALFPDRIGNAVGKPMSECSGEEILIELLSYFKLGLSTRAVVDACICLPCRMPFITSQFLTRSKGDRPNVIPNGSKNLALLGQYCEIPDDTVFTVEYSVRSAQIAVFGLLDLEKSPTPMYDGTRDLRVMGKTIAKMFT
jgi:oleate hydratase